MYGEWRTTPHQYVALVQRYVNEIGWLDWAAPQDWMCEPFVLAKTGKTITEHQRLTVNNYLDLKTLSPQLPIIPALQGWQPDDYLRHAEMYEHAGIESQGRHPKPEGPTEDNVKSYIALVRNEMEGA